jgi:DNA ligase (NAD+)
MVQQEQRPANAKPFKIPGECEHCGSKIKKIGAILYCTGKLSCPAQRKGNITHFASKRAMRIDGLGVKQVEQLVTERLVTDVADLYILKNRREEILALERWAELSLENLLKEIEKSKETTLARLIYALGIQSVGEHLARVLANNYRTLEALMNTTKEKLIKTKTVGPETASSILKFFEEPHNKQVIKKLKLAGVIYKRHKNTRGKLIGLTFLFTGKLESWSRDKAKEMVEAEGGTAAVGINKKLNYLVVGANPSSKVEKAKKLGLEIIDEEAFKKLVCN